MDRAVFLLSYKIERDELMNESKVEYKRLVYAAECSVRQSEFFAAAQAGLRSDFMLLLQNAADYHGEQFVEKDGKRYEIYRTYRRPSEQIELYCTQKVVDFIGGH